MNYFRNALNHPWWFEILRVEKRWSYRLERERAIENRDKVFIRKHGALSLVVSTIIVLFAPRPVWKFAGKCFFVSFGLDELSRSSILTNPERFNNLNFGLRAVFMGSKLAFVLNSIYLLINYPSGIYKWIRKCLLRLHFSHLEQLLPQLSRNIFLVKQDYFGPSSLLVTLSWHQPLHVVGIQHGLMDASQTLMRRLYPGIRTKIEFTYDEFYRNIFSQVKPTFTVTKVLGPPYEISNSPGSTSSAAHVVFISSGQIRTEGGRTVVKQVRAWAERDGLTFLLRPHPSEKDIEQLKDFPIDDSALPTLFNSDPSNTLFIGIFSSLLYQAAFKGFNTLWLQNESKIGQENLYFLSYLPNAAVILQDEMDTGKLSTYLTRDREPVNFDSSCTRLLTLLQSLFPGILI